MLSFLNMIAIGFIALEFYQANLLGSYADGADVLAFSVLPISTIIYGVYSYLQKIHFTISPWSPENNLYSYSNYVPAPNDQYGPPFEIKDGVAYSHLNCAESFALANNNYVYNSQYERDYHPLQYQWLKDHIYQGHEYPTPW